MSNITKAETQNLPANMDMFEMMDKALRFADIISKSDIIPMHYRGKPANCFIAIQTAYRMNQDPFLVMQNTFAIGGKLGMGAAYAISLANNSGSLAEDISFEVKNNGLKEFTKTGNNIKAGQFEDISVTARAVSKKGGKPIEFTVTMQMAVDDDWVKNAKYKSLPELMIRYRAATFLIRTACPQVLNGMQTKEELEDIAASEAKNVTPVALQQSRAAELANIITPIEASNDQAINENIKQEESITLEAVALAAELQGLIVVKDVPQEKVEAWLMKANVSTFEEMKEETLIGLVALVKEKY